MYSTVVLIVLFFLALCVFWLLLIGFKVHDKAVGKAEKYAKENFGDENKGENL